MQTIREYKIGDRLQTDGEPVSVDSVPSDMKRSRHGNTYVIRHDVGGFFIPVLDLEMI